MKTLLVSDGRVSVKTETSSSNPNIYTDSEKQQLLLRLQANDGNLALTSAETGVSESTLRRWQDEQKGEVTMRSYVKLDLEDPRDTLGRVRREFGEGVIDDVAMQNLQNLLKQFNPARFSVLRSNLEKSIGRLRRQDKNKLLEAMADIFDGLTVLETLEAAFRQRLLEMRAQLGGKTMINGQYTAHAKLRAAARLRAKMSTATALERQQARKGPDIGMWLQTLIDADARMNTIITKHREILKQVQNVRAAAGGRYATMLDVSKTGVPKNVRNQIVTDAAVFDRVFNTLEDGLNDDLQLCLTTLAEIQKKRENTQRRAANRQRQPG